MSAPDGNRLLTCQEVATRLGVSKRTVQRLVADSELIAPVTIGKRCVRFEQEDVEAYLEKQKQQRRVSHGV